MDMKKIYLCIDLKCFFASVECVERKYDPFKKNLVVADPSRGKGALCLAISPKMKAAGIKNRCRLFEIPQGIQYEIAVPRMKLYMQYSEFIYSIYLKYLSKDDIHVYSIDEAFLDVTPYLKLYQMSAKELALKILDDIYQSTNGITATVGIGTNLYLAKIAMDMIAKKSSDHIGFLNENLYQKYLWKYKKMTDFWHIGHGIANRLAKHHLYCMADVAHCPEDILYKEFGINAEYLIDHAWGREPTTIADIKRYQPQSQSLSHSQILFEDYQYEDALLVVKEMVEVKVLDLVAQHLVTDHISLSVGYSQDIIPPTGGSRKISIRTNSNHLLIKEFVALYHQTTRYYPIRKIAISFGHIMDEYYESFDLFSDYDALQKEKNIQRAIIEIKERYGKNAVLKGMNFFEKATTRKRNTLIGGHNAE